MLYAFKCMCYYKKKPINSQSHQEISHGKMEHKIKMSEVKNGNFEYSVKPSGYYKAKIRKQLIWVNNNIESKRTLKTL